MTICACKTTNMLYNIFFKHNCTKLLFRHLILLKFKILVLKRKFLIIILVFLEINPLFCGIDSV